MLKDYSPLYSKIQGTLLDHKKCYPKNSGLVIFNFKQKTAVNSPVYMLVQPDNFYYPNNKNGKAIFQEVVVSGGTPETMKIEFYHEGHEVNEGALAF
ncbi:MAG: hypothetical protein A2096_15230 [Spirochaetes bacterium GWF1_41_5]|nr:MAG: hypothetical protein A2096_15230 [Spirochaetes bacterium GWF1_41_5]HBE03263.1 hypothetical protein [Spirochaetia bacterium]